MQERVGVLLVGSGDVRETVRAACDRLDTSAAVQTPSTVDTSSAVETSSTGDTSVTVDTSSTVDAARRHIETTRVDAVVVHAETVDDWERLADDRTDGADGGNALVVLSSPESATDPATLLRAGATEVVETAGEWEVVLARRLGRLLDLDGRRSEDRERRHLDRTAQLREYVAEAADCENVNEIYELTVETAYDVFEGDAVAIFGQEGGEIHPRSALGDELHLDREAIETTNGVPGVAGETLRSGETVTVASLSETDRDPPVTDAYESAVSLPFGDDEVLQVLYRDRGAVSPLDRHLAELLVTIIQQVRQRTRSEEALRSERDWFAALFANMPSPAVEFRTTGEEPVIDNVNSNFIRVFGYRPEEAINAAVTDLLVPDGGDVPELDLGTDAAASEQTTYEVSRRTADGVRSFLLHRIPVSSVGDEQRGYFVYTDITERKRRERELERTNERLEEFASVVSHDLRNPLGVALGQVEMAREGHEKAFDLLDRSLERMQAIVDDLLTLARQGQSVGQTEPLALSEGVESAWRTVETADATYTVVEDVTVMADWSRLVQLFENLFRNSVEHGADDVDIHVGPIDQSVEDADGSVGFFVADDGPGIPKSERKSVLEYGYTTSEDGTGFGLAIVTEIAQAHGWDVRVTESDSGGVRFEITGVDRA